MQTIKRQHYNYIEAIAKSFCKTTNLEFEDLFQEAAIAYLKSARSFNPEKASFSTHLYKVVRNHLLNYIKKEQRYQKRISDSEIPEQPVYYIPFFEFWNALSNSSREVASVVLENKETILLNSPQQNRKFVRAELSKKGYSQKKIKEKIKKLRCDLQV
jgi:RNA polymerase sigma factor (sigma-70 family)